MSETLPPMSPPPPMAKANAPLTVEGRQASAALRETQRDHQRRIAELERAARASNGGPAANPLNGDFGGAVDLGGIVGRAKFGLQTYLTGPSNSRVVHCRPGYAVAFDSGTIHRQTISVGANDTLGALGGGWTVYVAYTIATGVFSAISYASSLPYDTDEIIYTPIATISNTGVVAQLAAYQVIVDVDTEGGEPGEGMIPPSGNLQMLVSDSTPEWTLFDPPADPNDTTCKHFLMMDVANETLVWKLMKRVRVTFCNGEGESVTMWLWGEEEDTYE